MACWQEVEKTFRFSLLFAESFLLWYYTVLTFLGTVNPAPNLLRLRHSHREAESKCFQILGHLRDC